MARRLIMAALAAGTIAALTAPAPAQFGGLFGGGNNPPRPPGSVPTGPIDRDTQFRTSNYPPATPLPPGPPPGSGPPPGPPPDAIQSQPLPPPPGAALPPPPDATAPGVAPGAPAAGAPAGSPAAEAPPNGTAPAGPDQTPPANGTQTATAPPTDEVVIQPPAEKIVNPIAVFAGLDKITGRIISFEAKMGETVQFGALQVTPHACYTRPPTETANTDGFIDVDEVTLEGKVKRIFTGWMFTASPGLHAVEHPIYDVWLTDCKGGAPTVTAEAPTTPPPPPAAAAPPRAQRPAPPRRAPPPPGAVPPPRQ